jgi:hypothetical protein
VSLPVDGIGADAHPLGADRGELVAQIAEMTGLSCADRRGRDREEEQHDRAVLKERGQ